MSTSRSSGPVPFPLYCFVLPNSSNFKERSIRTCITSLGIPLPQQPTFTCAVARSSFQVDASGGAVTAVEVAWGRVYTASGLAGVIKAWTPLWDDATKEKVHLYILPLEA